MSWFASIAIAGIQRYCESGAKVPDWNTVGDVSGLRISYQRTPPVLAITPECAPPMLATIEWVASSVVWSPKLR